MNAISKNYKVALAQYPILSHVSLDSWKQTVFNWVKDAAGSDAKLLVFPEYASIELTSFASADVQKNLHAQMIYLSEMSVAFIDVFQNLARHFSVYIVAPTIPIFNTEKNCTTNRAYFFSPSGAYSFQDKLFMTRFEDEEWAISSGEKIVGEMVQKVFDTSLGKISISTCFDIEFSDPSWAAASGGVELILSPSCTETIRGSNRVHIGARSRALENQCFVGVAQTIGEAPWSIATDLNVGVAAMYLPPDLDFPEDGIVAKGALNKAGWLTVQVDLDRIQKVRESGAVFNYKKNQTLSRLGRVKYQIEVLR